MHNFLYFHFIFLYKKHIEKTCIYNLFLVKKYLAHIKNKPNDLLVTSKSNLVEAERTFYNIYFYYI